MMIHLNREAADAGASNGQEGIAQGGAVEFSSKIHYVNQEHEISPALLAALAEGGGSEFFCRAKRKW